MTQAKKNRDEMGKAREFFHKTHGDPMKKKDQEERIKQLK